MRRIGDPLRRAVVPALAVITAFFLVIRSIWRIRVAAPAIETGTIKPFGSTDSV